MNTQRMRGFAIAAGMAGLLAVSVGTASAQASAKHAVQNSSASSGYVEGPIASQSSCLATAAAVKTEPYVIAAVCNYLDYSPFTGAYDPGWYLWVSEANPNL